MKNIFLLFLTMVTVISFDFGAKDKSVVSVDIQKMVFLPSRVKIKVNESVEWTNNSTMLHNIVAEDGSFKSKMLKKGEKFIFKFNKKGTFKYFCQPHKAMGMTGEVIVE